MLVNLVIILNWFILWYFIFLSFTYLFLLIVSIPEILFQSMETEICRIITLIKSHSFPPITIIISTYNEERIILQNVLSIINNAYPNTHIIIVNDGSTDTTLKKLIDQFELYPIAPFIRQQIKTISEIKGYYLSKLYKNLIVIDKEHTDKSDSLNMGINATHSSLFMTVDADTILEPDAISRIIYYFLTQANTLAVGGSVYILNKNKIKDGRIINPKISLNPLLVFQACEYLRSSLFNRTGWNTLGGALSYSGTCSLFRRHAVVKVGGFETNNLAQDFEIITHLHEYWREHHYDYHIGYTPATVAWTDVPETLKKYWKQRYIWQYYSLHSLMIHRKMLFNPKYGIVGLFTFPFFLFIEVLGAIVEFLAYLSILMSWLLGIIDYNWTVLFFVICLGFSVFLTMATTLINYITFNEYKKLRDLIWILSFSVIEIFGFRQFNVTCRVYATVCFFKDRLLHGSNAA